MGCNSRGSQALQTLAHGKMRGKIATNGMRRCCQAQASPGKPGTADKKKPLQYRGCYQDEVSGYPLKGDIVIKFRRRGLGHGGPLL